jgi:peptide chain release factor subunit 1
MAATVSWEALRELARFTAVKGRAISLYLDLDPRSTLTPGDAITRVNSLVDEAARRAGELPHDQRQQLKSDLDRIRRYVTNELDRDGARGLALFADELDNLWRPMPLTESVGDVVKVNAELHLTPLVPLVGRGEGVIVGVVGRERGDLYRLRGGRLEPLVDHTEEQPGRHDQGGWSQARFQRHIDNLVAEHLRDVSEELDRRVRGRAEKIVLVATEETRAELEGMLSREVMDAVVGWTNVEAHAGPPEVLAAVTPLLEGWRERRERDLLARWREETGRNGRAAAGWTATLETASDGRVELLLYRDGVQHPAWRCPACGRLSATDGTCPLDGNRMVFCEEGLDLALHQALAAGGNVWAVTASPDLDPFEGVGALLRY